MLIHVDLILTDAGIIRHVAFRHQEPVLPEHIRRKLLNIPVCIALIILSFHTVNQEVVGLLILVHPVEQAQPILNMLSICCGNAHAPVIVAVDYTRAIPDFDPCNLCIRNRTDKAGFNDLTGYAISGKAVAGIPVSKALTGISKMIGQGITLFNQQGIELRALFE